LPAAERWGSRPIQGRAQILETFPEDQRDGMPPYVVTGVVLRDEDPRGALAETEILIRSAIEAVRGFNKQCEKQIKRLGFWGVDLLKGVTPDQLMQLLSRALS